MTLNRSDFWVNCLFFVAVVCLFLFFKIDPEHSHETVFFSFNFWSLISIWSSWAHWHAQQWFSELARDLDQVCFCLFVVAKTKHAAFFFFFIFSFTSIYGYYPIPIFWFWVEVEKKRKQVPILGSDTFRSWFNIVSIFFRKARCHWAQFFLKIGHPTPSRKMLILISDWMPLVITSNFEKKKKDFSVEPWSKCHSL